jgi:hypothetical protein
VNDAKTVKTGMGKACLFGLRQAKKQQKGVSNAKSR